MSPAMNRSISRRCGFRTRRLTRIWVLFALLGLGGSSVFAQDQSFRFDQAGQLSGVSDTEGNWVYFDYGAGGNLQAVQSGTTEDLALFTFHPHRGAPGATVRIYGSGFGLEPDEVSVTIGETSAPVIEATDESLVIRVALGTSSGPITVETNGQTAVSEEIFETLRTPTIQSVRPDVVLSATRFDVETKGSALLGATFSIFPELSPPDLSIIDTTIAPDGRSATLSVTISPDADGLYALVAETAEGRSTTAPVGGNSLLVLDPAGDRDGDGLTNGDEVDGGTDPLTPDSQPPVVTWVSPTAGDELVQGESRTLAVDAADDGRVTEVRFSVDGTPLARDGAPPSRRPSTCRRAPRP